MPPEFFEVRNRASRQVFGIGFDDDPLGVVVLLRLVEELRHGESVSEPSRPSARAPHLFGGKFAQPRGQ